MPHQVASEKVSHGGAARGAAKDTGATGASKGGAAKGGKGGGDQAKAGVIVAVKSVEGQGINMQHDADTIVCRPTPGDHLEQMKGRVDRPGQQATERWLQPSPQP